MQTIEAASDETQEDEAPAPLERVTAEVEGLRGVRGAMLIRVQGAPIGSLIVEHGRADFLPGFTQGTVAADFEDAADIRRLLHGELNPVVASLQRRLVLQGDVSLGARIILGLRTPSKFEPVVEH